MKDLTKTNYNPQTTIDCFESNGSTYYLDHADNGKYYICRDEFLIKDFETETTARIAFTKLKTKKGIVLKGKEYFSQKLDDLKDELKSEIFKLFKQYNQPSFSILDESDQIYFDNNVTGLSNDGNISDIQYFRDTKEILINPSGSDLESIYLSEIENVHDLFLLYDIALRL